MKRDEVYIRMIQMRREQVGVRIGIAAFIGLAGFFLAPSYWPAIWFMAVLTTQGMEHRFSLWLRQDPQRLYVPTIWAGVQIMTGINSAVYVGLSAYLWFCGSAGQMFAIMILCGGLLHVCLHYHVQRAILVSAMIAQSSFLVGLPLAITITQGQGTITPLIVMLISAALYIGHLIIGVVKTSKTNAALSRATEAAERHREAAQSANRSKSDFLATISHEIRTPLNAVTTASHLLSQTKASKEQREYIAILSNGSDVLLSLINQVLDMSRIEAGKMVIETSDIELRDLSDRLLSLWRPKAREAGLGLTVRIDPDLPDVIRADPLRLNQILFNLVSNAVKFTDDGTVEVHIHRHPEADGSLVFDVVDTGPGMSDDVLARLFNSFEQADAGITRAHGGSGLGLSISRSLSELMGGDLRVSSRLGAGSIFSLTLPLEVGEQTGHERDDSYSLPSGTDYKASLSILVAEDHPVNRRLVALLLEPYGWSLTMVENGSEAVAMAASQPFDVILMDMQMPVMDGLVATRLISGSDGPNRSTPVIALTANAFDDQRQAWIEAGAFDFLTKPINPLALIAAIQLGTADHEPALSLTA